MEDTMRLRLKILSGFLILSLMLLLAGVWAVYQLNVLGTSAQRILDENYKSINAAEQMIEALERQDSAILLLLLGKWEEGRSILEAADGSFQKGLRIAEGNITISGEHAQVEAVVSSYAEYKNIWIRPIVGTVKEKNLNWYTEEVHPAFLSVKSSINKLLDLNDTAMYESASDLKDKARRAVTPGAVAVIAALIFSLLFNYFVNYYVVSPIIRLTRAVHDFVKVGKPFDVNVEGEDEIARLVSAINELCSAAPVSRKS
jgi:HAMP domain-containing protein